MKKKPAERRPQDVMQRFDRLLGVMAPAVEPKRPAQTKPRKQRGPKPKRTSGH